MLKFDNSITLGDIIALLLLIAAMVAQYIAIIRQLDGHRNRIGNLEDDIYELKRGRGLVLETWPWRVRQCFGFVSGSTPNGNGDEGRKRD